jgi:hypothetical protein
VTGIAIVDAHGDVGPCIAELGDTEPVQGPVGNPLAGAAMKQIGDLGELELGVALVVALRRRGVWL